MGKMEDSGAKKRPRTEKEKNCQPVQKKPQKIRAMHDSETTKIFRRKVEENYHDNTL